MSHMTTFSNKALNNPKEDMLASALLELELTIDPTRTNIKNTWIDEKVDMPLNYKGENICIGLNRTEDGIEVAGDFWGLPFSQEDLTNQIAQIYTKLHVKNSCKEAGWIVNDNQTTVDEDGKIHILAERWA